MSGKGAKGLLTGKTPASKDKDKDKKKPISRSSRAGLQVFTFYSFNFANSPCFHVAFCVDLFDSYTCFF